MIESEIVNRRRDEETGKMKIVAEKRIDSFIQILQFFFKWISITTLSSNLKMDHFFHYFFVLTDHPKIHHICHFLVERISSKNHLIVQN